MTASTLASGSAQGNRSSRPERHHDPFSVRCPPLCRKLPKIEYELLCVFWKLALRINPPPSSPIQTPLSVFSLTVSIYNQRREFFFPTLRRSCLINEGLAFSYLVIGQIYCLLTKHAKRMSQIIYIVSRCRRIYVP